MRLTLCQAIVPALAALLAVARADDSTSALASDPAGWADLAASGGPTFQGWSRGPIPPNGKALGPVTPSQWSLDPDTGHVRCRGNGPHEWIRWNTEVADGILHVEWRFTPVVSGKTAYNSGMYVRNSADARVWHQGQTGGGRDGYLFGESPADHSGDPSGKLAFFNLAKERASNREKPAGEWNTFEITFKGPELTLWVNGAVVNVFPHCGLPRGYVGLEAEGYEIEFRNVKLKTLKP